jgi:predicted nucleic acid-binding protein
VKQYVDETGAAAARQLFRRHRIVSSRLAPVELTSALSRRRTASQISAVQWARVVRDLQSDRAHWELLAVTDAVLARAEEVVRVTRLRSLDAVHVASAQLSSTLVGVQLAFVTADARQRDAAIHLGLEVVWVE